MVKRYLSTPVLIAVLAVIYLAAGRIGLSLATVNPSATAVWPATGIALAACLLFGERIWPGILLGAFLVNASTSGQVVASLLIAGGNTLEGLVGAYLVKRFANGSQAFERVPDIFKFTFLAGAVSPAVSATIGAISLVATGLAAPADFAPIWLTWWLGDAAGALIVAPLLILWARPPALPWSRLQGVEAGALLLILVLLSLAVFGGWSALSLKNYPLAYVLLPLVVWAAFRFQQLGAVSTTAILSGIAIAGTLQGFGPFGGGVPNEALLLLQGFMATVAVTSLSLAAVAASASRLYAEAQRSKAVLEVRVAERTEELRSLTARLDSLREAERAHLAREVHDELGGSLTSIKMDISRLRRLSGKQPAELGAAIQDLLDLVDATIHTVRRIATELRPPVLDDFGLAAAIEWQAQEFTRRTNIQCRLDLPAEEVNLERDVATAAFRVLQEALTNVVRHAQANSVEVRLARQGPNWVLSVIDDGRGFRVSEAGQASLGLTGMRERSAAMKSRLEIISAPGQGTTIRVSIPEDAPARSPT